MQAFHAQADLLLGKVAVNVDPFPTSLSMAMVPPWPLTISTTIESPMPRPEIAFCLGSVTR